MPDRGGQTLFTNQYVAYDTLPVDIRCDLRGRCITHVVTGLQLDRDTESSAAHPIVNVHPTSGRSVPLPVDAETLRPDQRHVAGSGRRDGRVPFRPLDPRRQRYRHTWSPGDVVMWDNRCVLHCADHAGVLGDRVMHRGMVAGDSREQIGPGPG